jgi:hypothetical protein
MSTHKRFINSEFTRGIQIDDHYKQLILQIIEASYQTLKAHVELCLEIT